jgi:hypothetical protein
MDIVSYFPVIIMNLIIHHNNVITHNESHQPRKSTVKISHNHT